jgi:hypothetical protein
LELERRQQPREFRVLKAIGRKGDGSEVHGTIENLSTGGAFFVCDFPDAPVKEKDAVTVEIAYRLEESGVEAGTLRCGGEVLRIEEYGSGAGVMRAFAIKFGEPVRTFGLDLGED